MNSAEMLLYKVKSLCLQQKKQEHIILLLFTIFFIVFSVPSTICGLYFPQKAVAAGSDLTPPPCITNSTKSPTLSTTTNKTLSVRGTIDLTKSTVKLDAFMILPGSRYTVRPIHSSFSINLLNNKGETLGHYPFEPKMSVYIPQNIDKMALVSEAIPFISCTKQIVITQDGRELASRTIDNHAPKVMIISPSNGGTLTGNVTVKWQASDADGGNNLTYFVLYSPDAGRSWQTIASDIKDKQLTVQMAELPGSSRALFRVIATDGVNTGISDSNSTFRVPSISMPAG